MPSRMRYIVVIFLIFIPFSISTADNKYVLPEIMSDINVKPLVYGANQMIVTNNPWASQTANLILNQGGNAIDAAIAAAFVLGLTEPQSSGIGGGGFALTYQASTKKLLAYNGREIAPQSATSELFIESDGQPMAFRKAMLSYRSIGVPTEVNLLTTLHKTQGKLPWKKLVQPAIDLALHGFPMSPRLHKLLTAEQAILVKDPEVRAIYFTHHNEVKPVNTLIKNPAYAKSLQIIAENPTEFYTGTIGKNIIKKINQLAGYTVYRRKDLTQYRTQVSPALCNTYREYNICTTPFGSGGVTVLELLQLYANTHSGKKISNPDWIYYFFEASKLAYADRNQYIADPKFTSVPFQGLLEPQYLQQRSKLITTKPLITPVAAGKPLGADFSTIPDEKTQEKGTTSIVIVDKEGNAISMTVTIEYAFGSHQFVDGFFLNNELTDFSFISHDQNGHKIANRVEPLKQPRSAIAPILVFDSKKRLAMLSASPGGAPIICYVSKNLIQMIDFDLNPKESAASGNLCALNNNPIIEKNSDLIQLISKLKNKDSVIIDDLPSGAVNIKRAAKKGWWGAADPRREGVAIGK